MGDDVKPNVRVCDRPRLESGWTLTTKLVRLKISSLNRLEPINLSKGEPEWYDTTSFQTHAVWPPMNRRTCVPARHRQHLHVQYQICCHFFENTKKYRRGDARQIPGQIPGANIPPAVNTMYSCIYLQYSVATAVLLLRGVQHTPPLTVHT